MRTTIRLNGDILEDAKAFADEQNLTFTALVEQALREHIARHKVDLPNTTEKIRIPTANLGLRPGVDLNDSAGLLDIMEADDHQKWRE